MRVTQSMVSANLLKNITMSYQELSKTQEQLSSGKKISKPSDDPVIATQGIAYRTDVSQVDQYTRNIDTANQWAKSSDSALNESNQILQRVRELTVQASSDTQTPNDRKAIKSEVDQLTQQLSNVANTQVAGKYIFNGTNTDQPPATLNTDGSVTIAATNPKTNRVMVQVNQGVNLQVNVEPGTVFSQKLFDDLHTLSKNLGGGADGQIISQSLTALDQDMSQLSSAQSGLGARENRISLISNRLQDQKQFASTIMSKNEDADFTATETKFQQEQATFTAALSSGAKMITPTLVDFLK